MSFDITTIPEEIDDDLLNYLIRETTSQKLKDVLVKMIGVSPKTRSALLKLAYMAHDMRGEQV